MAEGTDGIVVVGTKGESPTVRAHAVHALNFQLTWRGASVALTLVACCGTVVTLGLFLLVVAGNLVSTLLECGVGPCVDDPVSYLWLQG